MTKVDELSVFLNSHCVDVACITETWLKSSVPDTAISIDGFVVIRRDRTDSVLGGGVCIYIKQTLQHKIWTTTYDDDVESLWITIRPRRLPREVPILTLGVLYMPPGCSARPRKDTQYVSHILHSLDTISNAHPDCGIMVVGDFNHMKDKHVKNYPLKQSVKSPTHLNSTIDCIYTNLDRFYNTPVLFPGLGLSLHKIVCCTPNDHTPNKQTITLRHRTNDHNAKAMFVSALKNLNWVPLYHLHTTEEMWCAFISKINTLLDTFLPYQTVHKFVTDKPWVTEAFKQHIAERQRKLASGDSVNYNIFRNLVNRTGKSLRSKYYKRKVESLDNCNPRLWWRKTQELIGRQRDGVNAFSIMAEQLCGGDISQLSCDMNTFLQSVSSHLEPVQPMPHETCVVPSEYIISQEEVEHKLLNTNIHKSTGPDNFPNWILHDLAGLISGPICAIFNKSIQEGKLPTEWKRANVIPLPKVNPPRSIQSDIRPISLTCTLSKYMESFVGNWLLDKTERSIDLRQYGGMKGLSTTHALVDLLHHIHESAHIGNTSRICFIDYSKAFDLIDHTILIQKIRRLGVDDLVVRWINDYLSGREQRVKLGHQLSSWLKLNGAVPQGSCLGPLCFIIYVSDMDIDENTIVHKYIDDITVTECLSDIRDSNMQHFVDSIGSWSNRNNMKLNSTKTKEMTITFKKNPVPTPPLIYNNNIIERVHEFKLLGIWISDTLSWRHHVNQIHAKSSQRLYFMRQLRRCGLSCHDMVKFYRTIIRPILEYACPVWNHGLTSGESNTLEQIQRRALRVVYPDYTYEQALDETQLELLSSRRDSLCDQFFMNMCLPDSKLNYLLNTRDPSGHDTRFPEYYHCPMPKTERYKGSFVVHHLLNQ